MDSRPHARMSTSESLLERALLEAVERADEVDTVRARLLDAAYEQFCRSGIQRSSMEEVARRADLSRVTLYRKFESKDALVEQVLLREFRRYFDSFLVEIRSARTVSERIVLGFVSSLRAIRTNPLIGGLLDAEPTLFAGSMVSDGRMLVIARQFVARQLRREQKVGAIADTVDIDLTAEMMVRISASFLMVPTALVDLDDDDQLAAIARKFIVPIVEPGG
ncbi:MAG TPA: helix-turn-helix domain-containing protein [Rhodococcus sp. (in: high G+C Gram-positive bacteria)]|uniref:TetR/AcrR family transcriptional regulator n=1 Tax=Rhodococcus sp. SMB37 TaxID=2512213 RepID=UPI000A6684FC|nr:TetR/AcrR family transcriptional regulator [Rhodococcus sp. SMB37]TCN55804.1 TetR family transcriptional regulator [Rhodococcus sp. SMB37]HET8994934.1 helix-turn-helix domain-containing protein [Rhodococcus sp. (in: high G+C Gram-positive bacteria)]